MDQTPRDANKAAPIPHQNQNHVEEVCAAGINDEERDYQERWKRTSFTLVVLAYIAAAATIAVGIWELVDSSGLKHIIAWSVGAFFAAVSVPLSLHAIHLHAANYRSSLQRHYIRTLWMVPVYSIQSWCALRFDSQLIYFESFRATYEAYVIYNFYALLREFLGSTDLERQSRLSVLSVKLGREHVHHLTHFWLCFTPLLPKWRLDRQFLRQTLFGVVQ